MPPAPAALPERGDPKPRPVPAAPRREKMDISTLCSPMEARFERKACRDETVPAVADGMTYCRCHPEGQVPAWFGRDCIEAGCPLKSLRQAQGERVS